uniref:Prolamin-like domain-containing protein n=1 Tax=Quercus lobata TaxID=97700 RepID=A0A7N2QZI6_QUELO
MPSCKLRKIACLNCSPPFTSSLHCSITLMLNHLKEMDRVGGAASAPSLMGADQITVSKLSEKMLLPFSGLSTGQLEQDIAKRWPSLKSIDGCIVEIHGPLSKGKFDVSGPVCCKAITNISDKCWPKMF